MGHTGQTGQLGQTGHLVQTALGESLRGVEAEIAARQPERALMLAQDVQARYPRALAVQRVTGEVYLALRKTREAIGALDRALAGDPEDARACCARAIVQQIQGDSMGALAWYRRACDMRPGDKVLLSAYRELARSLNQPAYEPSRVGLARLYLRGSLFAHAIREWESILAERPDALEAQVGLVETLWCAGNTQAAAERCRRLLLNAPSCVKALLILAAIEHDAGHDDEARNSLRRAAELDPDLRIARELFADRLAANDRALSLLVFGEEPAISRLPSVTSVPLAQPARLMTGPLTGAPGMPAGRIGTGALGQPPSQPLAPRMPQAPQTARTTGTLPPPSPPTTGTLPPAAYGTSASVSRSNGLPPDFHRIFSETSGMLWNDDMEGQETQGRIPNAPPFDRSRADPFARSQQGVMPPALAGTGGSLEDTETRLSINFLNWLQAQGAVTNNLGLPANTGNGGNTGPVPVPLPPRPRTTSAPLDESAYPTGGIGGTGPLHSGTLPPPTPEALKAMFAELEPETASPRIVDADVVSVRDASEWNGQRDDVVAASPAQPRGVDTAGGPGDSAGENMFSATGASETVPPAWFDTDAASHIQDIATGDLPARLSPAEVVSGPLMPAAPEGDSSWWAPGEGAGDAGGASSATDSASEPPSPGPFGWAASANPAESATAPDSPLLMGGARGGASDVLGAERAQSEAAGQGVRSLGAAFSGFAPTGDEIAAESATGSAPLATSAAPGWMLAGESGNGGFAAESATASEAPAPAAGSAVTLEALEQGFARSGFEAYELRPGELAGMAAAMPETPAATDAPQPAHAPAREPDREDHGVAAPTPAPDDYAGRLNLARERRAAGNLDDALGEYRIILKNAPDLLGDVMDELNESLEAAPDHPEVHRLLGDAHIRQGDYLSALESYNRAVALTQAQDG